MAVKVKHSNEYSTWFITFTCYKWFHLFEIANAYNLVYEWFELLRGKNIARIYSYVIMPNHVHFILDFQSQQFDINKIIGNGKRFLAYDILNLLKAQNSDVLKALEESVSIKEKSKGQNHHVFAASFDAKPMLSLEMLESKLEYIHHNPVSGKWNLVKSYTDYLHSSAAYYEDGIWHFFKPDDYRDFY